MRKPPNRMKNLIFGSIISSLFITTTTFAAPAVEIAQEVFQPNGDTFIGIQKGDEWNHRMETVDGYTVSRDKDGTWRYVKRFGKDNHPVLSDAPAHKKAPSKLRKHLKSSAERPEGAPELATDFSLSDELDTSLAALNQTDISVLFLLAEFSDRKGQTTPEEWAENGRKIRDYYLKASHGNAVQRPAQESHGTPNDGVIGWLDLGYNHPDPGTKWVWPGGIAQKAAIAADPYIDYSIYDTNGDGMVGPTELTVVVVVAGYEQSVSPAKPSLWAHYAAQKLGGHIDGIWNWGYSMQGELHGTPENNTEHMATIGTTVHEMGHQSYKLPDLWRRTGHDPMSWGWAGVSKTMGDKWRGERPVMPSAWSKLKAGWATINDVNGTAQIPSSTSGSAFDTVFRLQTDNEGEYYLVENRQLDSYDYGLQFLASTYFTGGLAIWHVHDSSPDYKWYTDLKEADGKIIPLGGNLWTATNGGTFDDNSTPSNSNLYDGSDSGISVTNISASGTIMTADLHTPHVIPEAPTDLLAAAVSPSQIDLTWTDNANNETGFNLDRSTDQANWFTVAVLAPDSQSYSDTELESATTYYYRVRSYNNIGESGTSNITSATTESDPEITSPPVTPSGLVANNEGNGTALLNWSDVENEAGYSIHRQKKSIITFGWWTIKVWLTSSDTFFETDVNVTSLADNSGDGIFRYRIKAFNNIGESNWSGWTEVNVTGN